MRNVLGFDQRLVRRGTSSGPDPLRRLRRALLALLGVIVVGTLGYVAMGWSLIDAIYHTVTTVATVGYGEVQPLGTGGRIFTMALIIAGAGTVLYNLGLLVELVTEGQLRDQLERQRMDSQIARLRGHTIVCGYGRVGRAATTRLLASGHDVVVVDRDPSRLADATVPHLIGEAADDGLLGEAGIAHADSLIATLDTDAETVYLVLSARALRPDLTIVARARTEDSRHKLLLAGATRAVNPQLLGGRRMAVFTERPHVSEFVDSVMHDEGVDSRLHEVTVATEQALGSLLGPGRDGAVVLAVRRARTGVFETCSDPDELTVEPDDVLIVFGTQEQAARLRSRAEV